MVFEYIDYKRAFVESVDSDNMFPTPSTTNKSVLEQVELENKGVDFEAVCFRIA